MATVLFRPDYAKFMFEVRPELWNQMYRAVCELSHQRKFAGEFLKCHKTQRLRYNADVGLETWTLELWGEWAGLVEMFNPVWAVALKRFDVRAIVWDADGDSIVEMGQHLQRTVTSHNVYTYSTKPASKRLGRDRGGKGFAIGSHKSDLRITVYKRTNEPCAQEFQITGAMLTRLTKQAVKEVGPHSQVISIWTRLKQLCQDEGNKRLARVLESANVGTYWPVIGSAAIPDLPDKQSAFIAELRDIAAAHGELDEPPPPDVSER